MTPNDDRPIPRPIPRPIAVSVVDSYPTAGFDPTMVDLEGFTAALDDLRRESVEGFSEADFVHLRKTERWGRLCTLVGYATAWIFPNPLSAALLGLGMTVRFVVMHFVGHGAYDRVPGVPERYRSTRFARGWRRFVDWLDWIDPESWKVEHNHVHHHTVGQDDDPDLMEEHMQFLRRSRLPMPLRYAAILFMASTWRLIYNAPMSQVGCRSAAIGPGRPISSICDRARCASCGGGVCCPTVSSATSSCPRSSFPSVPGRY